VKGAPLLLYNAWDAGSAKSILAAGAQAIATSSWSVAEAQGYRDGEAIPIELAQRIVGRIVATIEAPVTVDSASISSSTPARMCFSSTERTQRRPSAKLSIEPRRMRLLARQASSSPA
jgi:hypothetical protein